MRIPGLPSSLYYGNLVNRASPLNRGLVSWWLALPQRGKGNTWFDIASTKHGTLSGSPSWRGAMGRPSGYGALEVVAASSQYVDCGQPAATYSATECTITGWMKRTAASGLSGFGTVGSSSGRFVCEFHSSGSIFFVADDVFPSAASNDLLWHHFAMVFVGGSRVTGYMDGVQVAETATGVPATTSSAASQGNFLIGKVEFGGGPLMADGSHDDVRAYNRALSGSEIAALYQDSLRGYPTTLNRVRPVSVIGEAGGAATAFPWHYYQQMQAMAG